MFSVISVAPCEIISLKLKFDSFVKMRVARGILDAKPHRRGRRAAVRETDSRYVTTKAARSARDISLWERVGVRETIMAHAAYIFGDGAGAMTGTMKAAHRGALRISSPFGRGPG
jgi:hypothetical protein